MNKLLYVIPAIFLAFSACKKDKNTTTGVQMNVSGPSTYKIEVVVGTPAEPITDIDKWRPDVVFWATVSNKLIELKPGTYTIVIKNTVANKTISVPVLVNALQVTQVKTSI